MRCPRASRQANGRLEAEQVEISAKLAGRIGAVLVKEGDMVHAGQVLARMDTSTLEAELAAAKETPNNAGAGDGMAATV